MQKLRNFTIRSSLLERNCGMWGIGTNKSWSQDRERRLWRSGVGTRQPCKSIFMQ